MPLRHAGGHDAAAIADHRRQPHDPVPAPGVDAPLAHSVRATRAYWDDYLTGDPEPDGRTCPKVFEDEGEIVVQGALSPRPASATTAWSCAVPA